MRNGRWSELSVGHKVRYIGNERFLVITMSKTSGLADKFYGLVVSESDPKIRQEFSSANSCTCFHRLVFSHEFQSTYLAFRSPANKTDNPPPK